MPIADGPDAVLMYHSVGARYPDGRTLTAATFRDHLEYLCDQFRIVDLPAVGDDGAKSVALTFDGGYENFYTVVRPILHEYGVPATQFVSPARIGSGGDPDADLWIDWFACMDADQVADLATDDLVTVGNKSLTHTRIMPALRDRERLRTEIVGAKEWFEEEFGITTDRFCYNSGRWDPASAAVVRESHTLGVTTRHRRVHGDENPVLLPRIDADFVDSAGLARRLSRRGVLRARVNDRLRGILGGLDAVSDGAIRAAYERRTDGHSPESRP